MDVSLSLNIYKGALNFTTLAQINIQKTALIFTFDLANAFSLHHYSTLTASTVAQIIYEKLGKQMKFHCIYCLHVLVWFKSCSFFMTVVPNPVPGANSKQNYVSCKMSSVGGFRNRVGNHWFMTIISLMFAYLSPDSTPVQSTHLCLQQFITYICTFHK